MNEREGKGREGLGDSWEFKGGSFVKRNYRFTINKKNPVSTLTLSDCVLFLLCNLIHCIVVNPGLELISLQCKRRFKTVNMYSCAVIKKGLRFQAGVCLHLKSCFSSSLQRGVMSEV